MIRRVEHGAQAHVRQKLWEALRCLVSNESFRDRLIYAAGPLTQLPRNEIEQLPDGVRDRLRSVVDALTEHPAPPHWVAAQSRLGSAGVLFSGIGASVRKLTPRQRRKIAEEILSLFVALSGGL